MNPRTMSVLVFAMRCCPLGFVKRSHRRLCVQAAVEKLLARFMPGKGGASSDDWASLPATGRLRGAILKIMLEVAEVFVRSVYPLV